MCVLICTCAKLRNGRYGKVSNLHFNAKVDKCIAVYAFATEQDTPIEQVLKMASTQGVPQYISFISGPLPIF